MKTKETLQFLDVYQLDPNDMDAGIMDAFLPLTIKELWLKWIHLEHLMGLDNGTELARWIETNVETLHVTMEAATIVTPTVFRWFGNWAASLKQKRLICVIQQWNTHLLYSMIVCYPFMKQLYKPNNTDGLAYFEMRIDGIEGDMLPPHKQVTTTERNQSALLWGCLCNEQTETVITVTGTNMDATKIQWIESLLMPFCIMSMKATQTTLDLQFVKWGNDHHIQRAITRLVHMYTLDIHNNIENHMTMVNATSKEFADCIRAHYINTKYLQIELKVPSDAV